MSGKTAKGKAHPRNALRVADALEQMESRRRRAQPKDPKKPLDLDFIP